MDFVTVQHRFKLESSLLKVKSVPNCTRAKAINKVIECRANYAVKAIPQ